MTKETAPQEYTKPRKPEFRSHVSGSFAKLGIHGPRLKNIGLQNAHTDFFKLADGDDTISIAVINTPLAGEGLNNLMAAVTPSWQLQTDLPSTITDLYLPKHAPNNEFDVNNREAILTALKETPIEINELYHTAWHTRYIDPETFGHVYMEELIQDIAGRYNNNRDHALNFFTQEFLTHSKLGQLFHRFRRKNGWGYENLINSFITSEDAEIQHTINETAIIKAQEAGFTLIDLLTDIVYPRSTYGTEDEEGYSSHAPPGLKIKLLPTDEVEYVNTLKGRKQQIVVAPSGNANEQNNAQLVATDIPVENYPYAVSPVVAYRTRPGADGQTERIYLRQTELEAMINLTAILPPNVHADVAAGQLAMAYLSPDIRQAVGAQMKQDGYADQILSAQNPVVRAVESIR